MSGSVFENDWGKNSQLLSSWDRDEPLFLDIFKISFRDGGFFGKTKIADSVIGTFPKSSCDNVCASFQSTC
jgi:hypothetical protein